MEVRVRARGAESRRRAAGGARVPLSAAVDVLLSLRTNRFTTALTYAVPGDDEPSIGDVVRVPLGRREVHGFVVAVHDRPVVRELRSIVAAEPGGRAFDEAGLALGEWLAERYCCSLPEALSSIVFSAALPRMSERIEPAVTPAPEAPGGVPQRLVRLIWEDFPTGVEIDRLLRHPEARRIGDRATILRYIGDLVRARAIKRVRRVSRARITDRTEVLIALGSQRVRGARMAELVAYLEANGETPRKTLRATGFSAPLIARATKEGVAMERTAVVDSRREAAAIAPPAFEPTEEQAHAIERITQATRRDAYAEILLQGVTGSGKTFVYLQAIRDVIARGGRAIMLVPEISLTPQTVARFEATFGSRIAVFHSALGERERYESWCAARDGDVDLVIGARSAVFAPLPNLRLIVIDEAHERGYKQDTVPRYQAADVARRRMELAGGVLVLGSATPPLDAYARALDGEIEHLRLRERATSAPLPAIEIVDMSKEFAAGNRRIFSTRLVDELGASLERKEKAILFINRRGSAACMLCRACSFVPECPRCSVSLVVHRSDNLLRCHYCDYQAPLPQTCPSCGGGPIRSMGVGTQAVAEAVLQLFPEARIVRMDSDTTTRLGDHARLLREFERSADILIGTQMVAKGLDFAGVSLACAISADIGLHQPDYGSAERTFDTLVQVAGRSGRATAGRAIVQTYAPDHPVFRYLLEHDFDAFAKGELEDRRATAFPPYSSLVYLGIIGRDLASVSADAQAYADALRETPFEVLGPAPFDTARVNGEWRYRIAVKASASRPLRDAVRSLVLPLARTRRDTRLSVNVDP